jgi:hypothetical protein
MGTARRTGVPATPASESFRNVVGSTVTALRELLEVCKTEETASCPSCVSCWWQPCWQNSRRDDGGYGIDGDDENGIEDKWGGLTVTTNASTKSSEPNQESKSSRADKRGDCKIIFLDLKAGVVSSVKWLHGEGGDASLETTTRWGALGDALFAFVLACCSTSSLELWQWVTICFTGLASILLCK